MELTFAEGRVLGCLVEKELTTPQLYPLTDNALVAACNQTTNREPVVEYDVATVRLAVRSLREKDLLRTVHRTGERADKHRHELAAALGLGPGEVALLGVLLLRGPQTPGELRLRTDRMHAFGSIAEVEAALDGLAGRADPLVARLERQPGQKESRYVDLLVPRDAPVTAAAPAAPAPAPAAAAPAVPTGYPRRDLAAEVDELRAEVAALRAEIAALRQGGGDGGASGSPG